MSTCHSADESQGERAAVTFHHRGGVMDEGGGGGGSGWVSGGE